MADASKLPKSALEGEWFVHGQYGSCQIRTRLSENSYTNVGITVHSMELAQFICDARNEAVAALRDDGGTRDD